MCRRPSARLLIHNRENEILLFRFENKGGFLDGKSFWATPGGGLEASETFEQAAKRELLEETGLQTDSLGAAVWKQEISFPLPSGEYVLAEEQFFFVRVSTQEISGENWTASEKELITDWRWWSAEALRTTGEVFFPENLPDLVQELIAASIG